MSFALQLRHEPHRHVEIATSDGALLWRYVYQPDTPANEAPRPFAHPVCSLAGDVLTGFRPADHPWHHALSLTLTRVDDVNFWGGPSYRAADGYQWRDDHGAQVHRGWLALTPHRLEERLDWCEPKSGRELLHEHRTLQTTFAPDVWSLRWMSELLNVTGRDLVLGNYHALGGLAGSHYTGLQFRGAPAAAPAEITADGGLAGESAVHGASARWMEWTFAPAGAARRARIRFENPDGPLPWFVRAQNPLAAFAFHREKLHTLPAGGTLCLDHVLTISHA